MKKNLFKNTYFTDCILLICLLGMFFGVCLGNRPFASPDEGRYVEIPREMVATGDYITPRLNGLKYFEKPVLFYWLEAGLIKVFGIQEGPLRLWPVFFGILGCLLVYIAGRQLINRATGLIGAGVLATSFLYFAISHLIVIDMPVSILVSGAMWLFIMGMQQPPGRKRRFCAWTCAAFLGLAVLAKGLMSLAIFGCVVFLWTLVNNFWKRLLPFYSISSLLIFLAIVLPWHILVCIENPEFFDFYFIQEHFARYLTNVHRRYKPFWFFMPVILVGFMPWTAFIVSSIKETVQAWRAKKTESLTLSFALIWAVFVFVFFSLSTSKLITYMIPMFPPLALLVAYRIKRAFEQGKSLNGEIWTYSGTSLLIVIAYYIFQDKIPADDFAVLGRFITYLVYFFVIGAVVTPLVQYWKGKSWALAVILLVAMAQLITLIIASPHATRITAKPTALAIKAKMPEDTLVVMYRTHYQDLPVYLDKTVKIVEKVGEMEFGHQMEPELKVILKEPEFWKLWQTDQPICIVLPQGKMNQVKAGHPAFKGHLLSDTREAHAYCNQTPEGKSAR